MKKPTFGPALVAVLLLVAALHAQAPIRASDAASRIGQAVTIEDVVAQVTTEPQSGFTYLNFGAPFPRQTFRAVIPEAVWALLSPASLREQTTVRVSGVPQRGARGPEIVCSSPNQLVVLAANGNIVPAAGLATPQATPTKKCCRVCSSGKPCGDSCISAKATCRQPPGCACGPQ